MNDVVDIATVLRRVTEPWKPQDLVAANDEADIVHGVQDRTAAGGPAHLEVGAELLDHDQVRHRASKGKWHRT